MAKDGTNRGGRRAGSGRKPKALSDKIAEGRSAKVVDYKVPDLKGREMPEVQEYMKQKQKSGIELCAEKVYRETYEWLKDRHCIELVNPHLIQQYAMSVARWVQCETAVNEFGLLAKHPTTGNAIASPFVSMSHTYLKQVETTWYQIYQIVKENCSTPYSGSPQDDLMTRLLNS